MIIIVLNNFHTFLSSKILDLKLQLAVGEFIVKFFFGILTFFFLTEGIIPRFDISKWKPRNPREKVMSHVSP